MRHIPLIFLIFGTVENQIPKDLRNQTYRRRHGRRFDVCSVNQVLNSSDPFFFFLSQRLCHCGRPLPSISMRLYQRNSLETIIHKHPSPFLFRILKTVHSPCLKKELYSRSCVFLHRLFLATLSRHLGPEKSACEVY